MRSPDHIGKCRNAPTSSWYEVAQALEATKRAGEPAGFPLFVQLLGTTFASLPTSPQHPPKCCRQTPSARQADCPQACAGMGRGAGIFRKLTESSPNRHRAASYTFRPGPSPRTGLHPQSGPLTPSLRHGIWRPQAWLGLYGIEAGNLGEVLASWSGARGCRKLPTYWWDVRGVSRIRDCAGILSRPHSPIHSGTSPLTSVPLSIYDDVSTTPRRVHF